MYTSHQELLQRQERRGELRAELASLHKRMLRCKAALREAVESRRMLEGDEIRDILEAYGLLLLHDGTKGDGSDDEGDDD